MVEARARQHQAVHDHHGEADGNAGALRAQHAAGRGAVPVEMVVDAPVAGRRDIGLAVDDVADMAEQAGVENGEHALAVVAAALVQTPDLRARRRRIRIHGSGSRDCWPSDVALEWTYEKVHFRPIFDRTTFPVCR